MKKMITTALLLAVLPGCASVRTKEQRAYRQCKVSHREAEDGFQRWSTCLEDLASHGATGICRTLSEPLASLQQGATGICIQAEELHQKAEDKELARQEKERARAEAKKLASEPVLQQPKETAAPADVGTDTAEQ